MLNKKDILSKLKDQIRNNSYYDELKDIEGVELSIVDNWGGEDEGSKHGFIVKVTNKDTKNEMYVQANGSYNSYEGTDYSYADVYEVEPYEKTVKAWRPVKN